jgi:glycogen operon protein
MISGRGLTERDELGRLVEDDDLLLLLNAHDETIAFTLPGREGERWAAIVDTSQETFEAKRYGRGSPYPLAGRSLALLVKPNRPALVRMGG